MREAATVDLGRVIRLTAPSQYEDSVPDLGLTTLVIPLGCYCCGVQDARIQALADIQNLARFFAKCMSITAAL